MKRILLLIICIGLMSACTHDEPNPPVHKGSHTGYGGGAGGGFGGQGGGH